MNNMLDFYQKNLECIKVIKPNIAKIENIIKEGIITEFEGEEFLMDIINNGVARIYTNIVEKCFYKDNVIEWYASTDGEELELPLNIIGLARDIEYVLGNDTSSTMSEIIEYEITVLITRYIISKIYKESLKQTLSIGNSISEIRDYLGYRSAGYVIDPVTAKQLEEYSDDPYNEYSMIFSEDDTNYCPRIDYEHNVFYIDTYGTSQVLINIPKMKIGLSSFIFSKKFDPELNDYPMLVIKFNIHLDIKILQPSYNIVFNK